MQKRILQEVPEPQYGMKGKRLLTNKEEELMEATILDCQERGVAITRYNILHMMDDFDNYTSKITTGELINDQ